jgi:3-oxoacyl-[acyl-carrier protein] reductase
MDKKRFNHRTALITGYGNENGITVNNVAPGWISTDASTEEERAAAMNTLMTRGGTPMAVADLIAFLASDASTSITGSCLNIDFGSTAGI